MGFACWVVLSRRKSRTNCPKSKLWFHCNYIPSIWYFAHQVVDHGMLSSYLRVEIYLTELKLAKWPHIEKIARKKFSKTDTIGKHWNPIFDVIIEKYLTSIFSLIEDVEKVFRETFEIAENRNVHLWIRSGSRLYEELIQKNQPIQELSLLSSQTIIGEDGTYGTKIADRYVSRLISAVSLITL